MFNLDSLVIRQFLDISDKKGVNNVCYYFNLTDFLWNVLVDLLDVIDVIVFSIS
jgi:hypothetical protein